MHMLRLFFSLLCSGAIGFLSGVFYYNNFYPSILVYLYGRNDDSKFFPKSNAPSWIEGYYLDGWILVAVISIIIFYFCYTKLFKNITTFKKLASTIVADSKEIINSKNILYGKNDLPKSLIQDEIQYYGQAEEEVESGNVDKNLWALAFVIVKGKEDERKVEYIKIRAKALQNINSKPEII